MAKAYWVVFYHSVSNPTALSEYGKLAQAAIEKGGGRFLARGMPARTLEGVNERSVVVEFDSVATAVAAYESPAYQSALKVLGKAVERDMRILEATA